MANRSLCGHIPTPQYQALKSSEFDNCFLCCFQPKSYRWNTGDDISSSDNIKFILNAVAFTSLTLPGSRGTSQSQGGWRNRSHFGYKCAVLAWQWRYCFIVTARLPYVEDRLYVAFGVYVFFPVKYKKQAIFCVYRVCLNSCNVFSFSSQEVVMWLLYGSTEQLPRLSGIRKQTRTVDW